MHTETRPSLAIPSRLATWFQSLPRRDQLGVAILVFLAIFAPFVDSAGWDYYEAFRRATLTGQYNIKTWNPYPSYWFFYPFAVLPPRIGFLFWNLVTAGAFIYTIGRFQGRFLPFALSLPVFWIFFIGQLEGFVALGLTLSMFAPPIIAGFGLLLLTLKPQIALFPLLFVLWRRRDWRMFIIPVVVYLLSFLQWGFWIPEWITAVLNTQTRNYPTNVSGFPYALLLLPLLWYARRSLKVWMLFSALLSPYFAVYSLAPLFALFSPGWFHLFIWLLYLSATVVEYRVPGFIIPPILLLLLLRAENLLPRRE
jgi:hypothetical protein